jgi:hypothetical protein
MTTCADDWRTPMTRFKTITALMLTVLLFMAVLAACDGNDTVTRLEGKAPYYTSVEDARAAAAEGQLIAVDFYTDW